MHQKFGHLTKRDRKQLNISARKVYRRILCPVYDNEKENWMILTIKEIYASVKKTPENIKESSHSAHASGMNECENALKQSSTKSTVYRSFGYCTLIM
jgi:hypothetical protein